MGLGVNLSELSRNIELFFKEKICEPSSRDGEPGGTSVHGGLAAVASREACRSAARRCYRAWELAAGWGKKGELRGVLAEGFSGRLYGEARPATVKGEQ
jgi:hypothetical protein